MVTDVLLAKQVLQCILHHSGQVLDIHQSLRLTSRSRYQDVLPALICTAPALPSQGRVPHLTPPR